jgi:hypothetical protein
MSQNKRWIILPQRENYTDSDINTIVDDFKNYVKFIQVVLTLILTAIFTLLILFLAVR